MRKRALLIVVFLLTISSVFSVASYAEGNKQVVTFGEFRKMFLNKPLNQLIEFLGKPTQEITNNKDGRLIEVLYEWASVDDMPIKITDYRKGYDKYYYDKISVRLNRSRQNVDNIIKEIYFSNQRKIFTDEAREQENLALEQERLAKEKENLAREKFEQKRKADKDKISNFNILELKLGIDLEGFKEVFPRGGVTETKSRIARNKIEAEDEHYVRYRAHSTGPNGDIFVNIPFDKYGYGAYSIKYKKTLREKVDESIFKNNLKKDLINKYGKPDLEYVLSNDAFHSYYFCWGSKCSAIKGRSGPAYEEDLLKFPEGKYLIVRYDSKQRPGYSYVEFNLFDNSPIFRFKEARKGRAEERAKEKIKF